MSELKAIAVRIARELLADLKAGKLKAIGIDQIEDACARSGVKDQDALIELTTRRLVELV